MGINWTSEEIKEHLKKAVKSYEVESCKICCPICGHDHYTSTGPDESDIDKFVEHIFENSGMIF